MKCSKCKVNERKGSLAYCQECHSAYVKKLREEKKLKMEEPVRGLKVEPVKSAIPKVEDAPIVRRSEESKLPVHPIYNAVVYFSYYVDPGTELHKFFLAEEKQYQVA